MASVSQLPTVQQVIKYFNMVNPRGNYPPLLPGWYDNDLSAIVELAAFNGIIDDQSRCEVVSPAQLIGDANNNANYFKHPDRKKIDRLSKIEFIYHKGTKIDISSLAPMLAERHEKYLAERAVNDPLCKIDYADPELPSKLEEYLVKIAENY